MLWHEMSWPETLSKERAALFRDSAHLFVHGLLQLKGGRESLRQFIYELQHHRNWQFAFLSSFSKHFTHGVDVEKFWGVSFVHFSTMGRKSG